MRRRRGALLWVLAVLAVGVLVGWGLASLVSLRAEFEQGREDRAALRSDITVLRGQLIDLGEKPAVGPSGAPGDRGERGRPGRDGRDGVDGITPACVFLPGECVGPTGPQGVQGAAGPAGADGVDGTDGTDGPPGPQGPPGPACPDSYSLQPDTLRGDDVMVCTKDEP